jgi:pantetheine-phosphate adenylyltransferase
VPVSVGIAICPGSFDPPTNGHVDVIQRACRHFDHVVVAVVENPSKASMFTQAERVALLVDVLRHLTNVSVVSHQGLLVDLAEARGASVIVKGLRALSDLERELQMAQVNAQLLTNLDTVFFTTDPKWSFVSSSLVKEVSAYGGDVSSWVPKVVIRALTQRSNKRSPETR